MFRYNEPLGLPRGSAAAILAVLSIVGLGIMGYVNSGYAGAFCVLAGVTTGFFLGQRATQEGDQPRTPPVARRYKSIEPEDLRAPREG